MRATGGRRYLDVGCGIGTKLVVAAFLGLDVHGIELREHYVAAARHLCPEAQVEIGDARGYHAYGGFDIIYCYRPLREDGDEAALEELIARGMRSGAILILPDRMPNIPTLDRVGDAVWSKR